MSVKFPELSIIGRSATINRRPPRINRQPPSITRRVGRQIPPPVTDSKPFVIITVGPTGAGKTGLVNETIKYCRLNSNSSPRVFLVDDLVVNNQIYKDKVLAIIRYHKITSEKLDQDVRDKTVIDAFNKAYWEVRKSSNCVVSDEKNCDDVTDSEIRTAIAAKQSFVLEITGSSIPAWLLGREWLGTNTELYDVFVSCVFVSNLDDLIQRNKSRFKQSFELFTSDPTKNPAPRLPNITQEQFNQTIVTIKNTVKDMYSSCVLPDKSKKDESKCGNENIDQLLVFSNNNEGMKLKFDSKLPDTKTSFQEVIDRLYTSTSVPGGRRRKTQKRRKFHKRNNTKKTRKSIKNKRIRKHSKIYIHP